MLRIEVLIYLEDMIQLLINSKLLIFDQIHDDISDSLVFHSGAESFFVVDLFVDGGLIIMFALLHEDVYFSSFFLGKLQVQLGSQTKSNVHGQPASWRRRYPRYPNSYYVCLRVHAYFH